MPRPLSVMAAVKSGDRRKYLLAKRDRLAITVNNPKTPASALQNLFPQLDKTLLEIDKLDARMAASPQETHEVPREQSRKPGKVEGAEAPRGSAPGSGVEETPYDASSF